MNVSAIIVTRGDVELEPVIESLPRPWEILIWDNGGRTVSRSDGWAEVATDLSVYGRYAAIEYATHDILYVQDDDCIVSDPQAIMDEWVRATETDEIEDSTWWPDSLVVCNMPPEFRHDFYTDHSLVGFGAAFHRDAPARAFTRFWNDRPTGQWPKREFLDHAVRDQFDRDCDIVFTALTPRVLVDVPYEDLPHAHAPNRMWKQKEHQSERQRMLELVRQVQ